MGGRSYMLAARVPMPPEAYATWLADPVPGLEAIDNPADAWPDWSWTGKATPAELIARRAGQGFNIARHRDGHLEVYLYDYHVDLYHTQAELLMLAGAARFVPAGRSGPAMFWGGDVYPDLPLGEDRPHAVLLVGSGRARFLTDCPLPELIEQLRPVETDFLAGVDES